MIFLLPNFAIAQPEKGMENRRPTGIDKRTIPNAPFVSPNCCWILGILDAQVAKHRPCRKNMIPTAILYVLRDDLNASAYSCIGQR